MYLPDMQLSHIEAPCVVEAEPGAHVAQTVALWIALYVPDVQIVQKLEPDLELYLPCKHPTHTEEVEPPESAEADPAAHPMHTADDEADIVVE